MLSRCDFSMLINHTPIDTHALTTQLNNHQGLTIACYCAQWCGTCKSYRTDFAQLSEKFPQHLFVWIDIEDNPELLDDIDVENFPTLLIQQQDHNYFLARCSRTFNTLNALSSPPKRILFKTKVPHR